MPLGSPIGSNRGIETRRQIEIIIEQATVPVIIDAGLGAPSHAAEAMEMGADAVLINTALAISRDPVRIAQAFRQAIEAGRTAYELGLPTPSAEANCRVASWAAAACSTWRIMERPARRCITLGRRDFMRVPWPAARTTIATDMAFPSALQLFEFRVWATAF